MTPNFQRALARTVRIEGGFVDNPHDRGGPTNFGITLGTLRRWYPSLGLPEPTVDHLRSLTHSAAANLYFDLYWRDKHLPCEEISDWWEPMGAECFDSAVLHGPVRAAVFLQKALNLLNRNEKSWPDLKVDGWAGNATLNGLISADHLPRGRERLMIAVNAYQAKFLIEIAENDPTQEEFVGGWLLHRVQMQGEL